MLLKVAVGDVEKLGGFSEAGTVCSEFILVGVVVTANELLTRPLVLSAEGIG